MASRQTSRPRECESLRDFARAQEYGAGLSFGSGHHVDTPVHAVDEVDVGRTRGAEHDLVSGSASPMCMRRWVFADTGVRLDFGEPDGNALVTNRRTDYVPEEIRSNFIGRPAEEFAGQFHNGIMPRRVSAIDTQSSIDGRCPFAC